MSRNVYLKLKSVFHCCNNDEADLTDRCYKIRPLITKINEAFLQWGVFSTFLSIDEMIVKYYGHNRLKQFIQSKPIRFGYKLWAHCSSGGYCYKFSVYASKDNNSTLGLLQGSQVIINLLEDIQNPNDHAVFFDNFFTNCDILIHLKSIGFRATGTMRENRTDKCPLLNSKELSKKNHGRFDFRFDKNGEVLILKWNDNKCVTMGTNFDTIELLGKATRWSKSSQQKLSVPQLNIIKTYNKHMRGVDHHDWLVGKYTTRIRGKKWYWPTSLSCLDFRRSVAMFYLKLGYIGALRKRNVHGVVPDVQYDGNNHWIRRTDKQRRCQFPDC
ncbi:hypothetical protein ILUMI_12929 [Ignelater luminosus]|uniref:PiggyBac transposable element-derived protein domain-containing protein n=1 Tax=Ignelater luminosus TaxID=2038154 RepID=A0A8K0CYP3_IGNLU|nr:hypothetical protein ILUMI_12929 [Ignelater luminosus]